MKLSESSSCAWLLSHMHSSQYRLCQLVFSFHPITAWHALPEPITCKLSKFKKLSLLPSCHSAVCSVPRSKSDPTAPQQQIQYQVVSVFNLHKANQNWHFIPVIFQINTFLVVVFFYFGLDLTGEHAVTARVWVSWNAFLQPKPLLLKYVC